MSYNLKQRPVEKEFLRKAGNKCQITLATRLAGRGFDVQPKDGMPLRVLIVKPPRNKRMWRQFKGRTARRGAKGYSFTIINKKDMPRRKGGCFNKLEDFHFENEALDHHEWKLSSHLAYVQDAFAPLFIKMNQSIQDFGDTDLKKAFKFEQVHFLEALEEAWEEKIEEYKLDELWSNDNQEQYEIQLEACKKAFLKQAIELWNEEFLSKSFKRLEDYARKQKQNFEKRKAQEKLSSWLQKNKQDKETKDAKDKGDQKVSLDATAQQELDILQAEEKAFQEKLDTVEASFKACVMNEERLLTLLPQESLPYLDLPLFSDIPENLQDPEHFVAPFESKLYHSLCTLVKTEFLYPGTPPEEVEAAIQAILKRDCPELNIQTINYQSPKSTADLRTILGHYIRITSNTETLDILLDYEHHSVSLGVPAPILKPEPQSKSFNWAWFFIFLACCIGGIALSLTLSLWLHLFTIPIWSVSGALLSLATLSNPGFWLLIGLGVACGLVAFLAIFALVKSIQKLQSSPNALKKQIEMLPITGTPDAPSRPTPVAKHLLPSRESDLDSSSKRKSKKRASPS